LYYVGLWLKVYKQNSDIDRKMSNETFDTDVQTIKNKKEALSKITSKEFMMYMDNNHIHQAHSRYKISMTRLREKHYDKENKEE